MLISAGLGSQMSIDSTEERGKIVLEQAGCAPYDSQVIGLMDMTPSSGHTSRKTMDAVPTLGHDIHVPFEHYKMLLSDAQSVNP